MAEATAAPSEQGKGWCVVLAHTAPHPSLLRKATFPQGKAILCPTPVSAYGIRSVGALFLLFAPVFRGGHAGFGQELPVQATDGPEARLGADVSDTVLGPGQQVLGLL